MNYNTKPTNTMQYNTIHTVKMSGLYILSVRVVQVLPELLCCQTYSRDMILTIFEYIQFQNILF